MKKITPKSTKRGISLMEVVIAMFIIVLITLASTSLVLSSIKQEKNFSRNVDIAITAENTIECFTFTDNFGDLLVLLKEIDSGYVSQKENEIILNKGDYHFKIITDYSAKSIEISAYQGETLIKTFSFSK